MARITGQGDPANIPGLSGTSTKTWGPTFPFTPPVDSQFAWINQGSATITDLGGALALASPAAAGPSLVIRKKAAPSTPYTIDIVFLSLGLNADFVASGFVWRQSSDGKLVTIDMGCSSSSEGYSTVKWNSPTSFSGVYTTSAIFRGMGIQFFRAQDDGVNRIASYSYDGQNYFQFHSVGRTDFMTADEVGFYTKNQNSSLSAAMTLLSWKQS